jgi:hypothetical protein
VNSQWFDEAVGGVSGLGLDFADSFFLIGDPTTFGVYRHVPKEDTFLGDEQAGENCGSLVRQWLKEGQIDSFHAFLHYTRRQVEPLLKKVYSWCECEGVAKPRVWINHSAAVTPSGLCPDHLQPSRLYRLFRLSARNAVGPFFGRKRFPLRYALVRYRGDTPGSQHYVNDLLAANGLRYVWLNMGDLHRNRIALPEHQQKGRTTILRPITMDDGVCYWRFERCYGWQFEGPGGEAYLRDSKDGSDASHLITEKNLQELCNCGGTCILYTHWTHSRSMPIADETIARFKLLQRWRDAGRIWVTSTSRLLEWTRLRTFLRIVCRREGKRLIVEIEGVDDPICGRGPVELAELHGLSFRLKYSEQDVILGVPGKALKPGQLRRLGDMCWLDTQDSCAGARAPRVGSSPKALPWV